jgi:Leucine-rich repeat (LRR) protein
MDEHIVNEKKNAERTRVIDLYQKGLLKIDNTLEIFPRLLVLKLNRNRIRKLEFIPDSLKELHIMGNGIAKIENLPDGMSELDISFNKIGKLENLPSKLKNLNACHNNIGKLEGIPENIHTLNLKYNHIKEIDVTELPVAHLQSFDIDFNQLGELTDDMLLLKKLKYFGYMHNRITVASDIIRQWLRKYEPASRQITNLAGTTKH